MLGTVNAIKVQCGNKDIFRIFNYPRIDLNNCNGNDCWPKSD